MNVETLYIYPREEIYKSLKMHIDKNSVTIAFIEAYENFYLNKKIIWNCMSLLKSCGICCVICNLKNIGDIIRFCEQNNYAYDPVIFFNHEYHANKFNNFINCGLYYVFIYKESITIEEQKNIIFLRNEDLETETIRRVCQRFSSCEDVVLLVGDYFFDYVLIIKNLFRYVVGFCSEFNTEELMKEGFIIG